MYKEENRILVFTDWFLPGYKAGGPVSSLSNLFAHFSSEYSFYVLTRNTDYKEEEPYPGISYGEWIDCPYCEKINYLPAKKQNRRNMLDEIRKEPCNTWYVNGIYSWYFSILPVLLAKREKPGRIIVAPRGMLSGQGVSVKTFKKRVFLFLTRLFRMYGNVIFHATSEQEKRDIQSFFPSNRIVMAVNLPRPILPSGFKELGKSKGMVSLVSIARVAPEKNILGAIEYLKYWAESDKYDQAAQIRYEIYGQIYSPEYWKKCRVLADSLPGNIEVLYLGSIRPELVGRVLEKAHFLYLPTLGENYGHSIIEALGAGRPVIISDRTPWNDLVRLGIGWDIALEKRDDFTEVIYKCLVMDQAEYNGMCKEAINYALAGHPAGAALDHIRELFTGKMK